MTYTQEEVERSDIITQCLERKNFVLYAQPIISATGRNTISCYHEVLLRLQNGDELIYPDEFFPVAERLHLGISIDKWVIKNSLRLLQQAVPEEKLSINITKETLQTGSRFSSWLTKEVNRSGLAEERIEIEVDESDCLQYMNESQEIFSSLTAFGCRIAIDDYLARDGLAKRLQSIPSSVIKINGSIVHNITKSTKARKELDNIVAIAQRGERKTVAEFVTSRPIAEALESAGVDFLQGSWVGPTISLEKALGITTSSSSQ